jgi:hypothetical protein
MMSIEKATRENIDYYNIVPIGLVKKEEGVYKEKISLGAKTGSPGKRKDNEISLCKYNDKYCKYCNEKQMDGVFIVEYNKRIVFRDKRRVSFVCKDCLEEKEIVEIEEKPDDLSLVGGF